MFLAFIPHILLHTVRELRVEMGKGLLMHGEDEECPRPCHPQEKAAQRWVPEALRAAAWRASHRNCRVIHQKFDYVHYLPVPGTDGHVYF